MFRMRSVIKDFQNIQHVEKHHSISPSSSSYNGLFPSRTNLSLNNLRLGLFSLTIGNKELKRYLTSKSEVGKVQPPIGVSDFRKLISYKDPKGRPYLFIDKSLFVMDLMNDPSEVILFPRPRRFGKTSLMSLLHHFLAREVDNEPTKELFRHLKISQHQQYMKYQGQFPVVFLTLKDIKSSTFSASYADFCELIRGAYLEHEQQVLSSSKVPDRDKKDYELILDRKAPDTAIRSALKNLTACLNRAYGVKPFVLIDEYDTPIQTAYVEKYYKEMITFMREFLGAGLKDNSHLNKAVLTGILRISKESLFSGLNNLKVYSLLNSRYGEYFGFTEEEISDLVEKANLSNKLQDVRKWYNGYQAGNIILYNPWSIVNFIQEEGRLSPYWVNTSDNSLIKELLIKSSTNFKIQFESLLQGNSVEKLIDENIVFDQLESNESSLWTLLLMSGYLKVTSIKETGQGSLCRLEIPNKEIRDLYRMFIAEWLSGVNDATVFNAFLIDLLNGNVEDFEDNLRKIMLQTFSIHDIKGKNPEKFFHGFILGLISGIDENHYKIDSNKESGLGRYDIILVPNDPQKLGIILEIKSVEKDKPEALKEAADNAIKQIDEQRYTMTPLFQNISNCLKIGIAFSGKELAIAYKRDRLESTKLSLDDKDLSNGV